MLDQNNEYAPKIGITVTRNADGSYKDEYAPKIGITVRNISL